MEAWLRRGGLVGASGGGCDRKKEEEGNMQGRGPMIVRTVAVLASCGGNGG